MRLIPPLLTTRRFLPLFATQGLGALNDNLFKNALAVFALFKAAEGGAEIVALASGIFILPYLLFSATAGEIADSYEKSRLIRRNKLIELALMAVGAAGFLLPNLPLLLAVLFGLGCQATFFGPLKYAILPSHLAEGELVAGNGLIEAGTFLGILAGTILGGALILAPAGPLIVSALGLAIAAAGLAAAWRIPQALPNAAPLRLSRNIAAATWRIVQNARADRAIWRSILGLSWFWTLGAMLIAQFPIIAKTVLGAGTDVITALLAMFALGIGLGSILCARLLRGQITWRYVPYAALGISLFAWDFAHVCPLIPGAEGAADLATLLARPLMVRALADLALLAICGGLYSVPLYAIIQDRAAPAQRSRMISANNIVNAAAIVAGAVLITVLARDGMSAPEIITLVAAFNLAVAGWMLSAKA